MQGRPEGQIGGQPEGNRHRGQPGADAQRPEGGGAGDSRPGGNGGPWRASPALDSGRRTRVQGSFRTINVSPIHVAFNVKVGVVVPQTIVLQPLPPTIVTIVPGYDGFEFFEVPGQVVIVDPGTLVIVEVLPL